MKKSLLLIAVVTLVGIVLALPRSSVRGQMGGQDYTSFQLVYHSDTRGYYRPCG